MIGFTQYCPAVLALLINREEFYPLIVNNSSEITLNRVSVFLNKIDSRIKVIVFSSVAILDEISQKCVLDDVKIIVLDTISDLERVDLEVIDVQKNDDNSTQFFSITPSHFNKILDDCGFGVSENGIRGVVDNTDSGVKKRTRLAKNNFFVEDAHKRGELGNVVHESVSKLRNREKYIFSEHVAKFVTDIITERQFKEACSRYDIKNEYFKKVLDYTYGEKGKSLKLVFMDVNIYTTDCSKSLKEFEVNRLDYDFITSFLSVDKEYRFISKIPTVLVKKRRLLKK